MSFKVSLGKRLGNMVLMRAGDNRDLGNKSFADKKAVFGQSGYATTLQVSSTDRDRCSPCSH